MITVAPWYLTNNQVHENLNILPVKDIARKYACSYEKGLHFHSNIKALMLLESSKLRRLKKKTPNNVASMPP